MAAFDPALALVGLSGSQLIAAGKGAGLAVLNEAFADRRYQPNGQLVSRETWGALVTDPEMAAQQAQALARGEPVVTLVSPWSPWMAGPSGFGATPFVCTATPPMH